MLSMDLATRVVYLCSGEIALVSECDYERVSKYIWRGQKSRARKYAHSDEPGTGEHVSMHRLVMQPPADKVVDHINGCGLDNRRENLRICTQLQNARNKTKRFDPDKHQSQFIGITRAKTGWRLFVNAGGRHAIGIGFVQDEARAAKLRDSAALYYYGEFAKLNFPLENTVPMSIEEIRSLPEVKNQKFRGSAQKRFHVLTVAQRIEEAKKYRGVSVGEGGYKVNIQSVEKRKSGSCYLGRYEDAREAAIGYDSAAKYLYGAGAVLNFPEIDTPARSPESIRTEQAICRRSGLIGARQVRGGKWEARGQVDHKKVFIGLYDTKEEALAAHAQYRADRVASGGFKRKKD